MVLLYKTAIKIVKTSLFTLRVFILSFILYTFWRFQLFFKKKKLAFTKNEQVITFINTLDNAGGAAKVAISLFNFIQTKAQTTFMFVGQKHSKNPNIFEITRDNSTKQIMLFEAQKKLQWQDFFHLSSLKLFKNIYIQQSNIIHLHNLHSWHGYFSPFALPELCSRKQVIWTLHDMHALTGHCAHSFECEKWKTGCGNCPQLDIYPKLTKDTTSFIWKTKKRIYKSCDMHIVVPSKWLQNIVSQSILSHLPCTFIYNGVDTNTYKPHNKQKVRTLLELPHNKIIILFSADLGVENPFKGGEYIMQLIQKYSKNSQLLFVNIGGDVHVEKQEHIWNIPYITKAEDMAHWYSAADVYVYPSLADNCPLAILEAMACGLPIVTFNTGGIPELVLHNETGYIADYKNFDDLCAGFEMLINNADMRELLSKKGVERVRNFFTIETMNEAYQALYNSL